MAYNDMSDKDKIKSIIANIMEWPCFDSGYDYLSKVWETGEYIPTSYPVAFFDFNHWHVFYSEDNSIPGTSMPPFGTEGYVFYIENSNASIFDPLHNLSDAGLVITSHKFKNVECKYSEGAKDVKCDDYSEGWKPYIERWQLFLCSIIPFNGPPITTHAKSMPEAICEAVLLVIDSSYL